MYKYFLFIFILHLLNIVECRKRICRNKKAESDVENDTSVLNNPNEVDIHLPMQQCAYTPSMTGKIINPYRSYLDQNQDIFKSACVKCAACIAIAQNMNETFRYQCKPGPTTKCIYDVLEPLCSKGFKNYDLREVNGNVLLTEATANNRHVASNLDGSWTPKLRETCWKYLRNINCDIQHRLKLGTIDFVDYICNGDGLFRDCHNINLKPVEIPIKKNSARLLLCVSCN